MQVRIRLLRIMLVSVSGLLLAPLATAQGEWPARQVRIVVPFAAGGTTDIAARVVGEQLAQVFKQPFVIDN